MIRLSGKNLTYDKIKEEVEKSRLVQVLKEVCFIETFSQSEVTLMFTSSGGTRRVKISEMGEMHFLDAYDAFKVIKEMSKQHEELLSICKDVNSLMSLMNKITRL